jgi:hypothetical protein
LNPQRKRRRCRPIDIKTTGSGTACERRNLKDEERSGTKKLCPWIEENCIFAEKFL